MRASATLSLLATAALLTPVALHAEPQPPSDVRKGMRKLEKLIGEAVSRVSRASVVPVLGAAESCRGYYLEGYGAFFVVSPRCVSAPANPTIRRQPLPSDAALREAVARVQASLDQATDEGEKSRLSKALKDLQDQQRTLQARDEALFRQRQEQEMKAFEVHVRLMQQEAERSRREAETAMQQVADRLHMTRTAAEETAAAADGTQTPPWHLWVDVDEPEERSPERVLAEVKTAVAGVLKMNGRLLGFLTPEERVSVAVDFYRPTAFASCGAPQRTLLVRAYKRVLDQLAAAPEAALSEGGPSFEFVEY